MPTVNLQLTEMFLRQIAESDRESEHVIIWDQAGFHHKPKDSRLPARIHVLALPAYSPELNPIEKLWDGVKDRVVNRVLQTLEQIESVLSEALRAYWESPKPVQRLLGRGWLYRQANHTPMDFIPIIN